MSMLENSLIWFSSICSHEIPKVDFVVILKHYYKRNNELEYKNMLLDNYENTEIGLTIVNRILNRMKAILPFECKK